MENSISPERSQYEEKSEDAKISSAYLCHCYLLVLEGEVQA